MTCPGLRLKLHGLLDGELDPADAAFVNAHLATCPGCTEELESLRALREAVAGEARYHAAPEGLAARLSAALRAEAAPKRRRRIPRAWMAIAAAVLPVAILAAGMTYYYVAGSGGGATVSAEEKLEHELVADHIRSLLPNRLTDIASSDQHVVKPWFEDRLDVAPPVRDLADSGFPLVGGRLDDVNGRRVAAIVYRRGGHYFNVFIWPDAKAAPMKPMTADYQGYHLVHWTGPGIQCWAVSDADPRELDQLQAALVW